MGANLASVALTFALAASVGPTGSDKAAPAATTAAAPTASATAAQPSSELGEMVTDRPDFTESSEVVGKGIAQLETGMSYEGDGQGDARSRGFTTPQALLRVGLSKRVELRLGGDGFVSERAGVGPSAVHTTGGSDFDLGMKVRLASQDTAGFDVAIIPILSLPVGSEAFSSGGVDPTVKFTWARSLPAGFDLSGNVNVSSLTQGDARFSQMAYSWSAGHDLVAGWGMYWELYGFSALEKDGDYGWTFNTGVSHPIGPNRQVDFTVGHALTGAAPDWFVSAGFSVRGAWKR
jgi:outer membrane putative beta-barrel porin/alpha-amylase